MLLVNKMFVFMHIPKTGGIYTTHLLGKLYPSSNIGEDPHLFKFENPEEYPILAGVRNPYDWYVSWFHYNLKPKMIIDPFFEEFSKQGHTDFQSMLYGMLTNRLTDDVLGRISKREEKTDGGRFCLGVTLDTVNDMVEHNIGLLTSHIFTSQNNGYSPIVNPNFTALRLEHVKEDLICFIKEQELFTENRMPIINSAVKENASERRVDYMSYYTPELIELVNEKDRLIFETYGYEMLDVIV